MYKRTYKQSSGKKSQYGHDVGTISSKIYSSKQGRTDYAVTLVNPELKVNARIPDLACYPTATFSSELHTPFKIDNRATSANSSLIVVNTGAVSPTLYFHQGALSNVTKGAPNSGGLGAVKIGQTGDEYALKYKAARLVSAMVKVTFAGQDTATEGSISGAYFPADWGYSKGATLPFFDPGTWNAAPDYYQGPVKNGCCVRYKPVDSTSFDMKTTATQVNNDFGTFMVLVDVPVAVTSVTMQIDIVLNWEGIVVDNTLGIPVGISGADPGALAHGLNAAGSSAGAFACNPLSWQKNVDGVLRSVA